MRTADISMVSILTMLSTLSPEDKSWLGHRLLYEAMAAIYNGSNTRKIGAESSVLFGWAGSIPERKY